MTKKEEFIKNLGDEKRTFLINYINSIWKDNSIVKSEEANSIIYLAWLYKNGLVSKGKDNFDTFNEAEAGATLSDYEDIPYWEGIYFPGSNNLESIHMQYHLEHIMEML